MSLQQWDRDWRDPLKPFLAPQHGSRGGISEPKRGKFGGFQTLTSNLLELSKPYFWLVPFGILKRTIMRRLRLIKIQNSTTPAKTTLLVLCWLLWLLYVCDKNLLGLVAE